MPHERFQGKTKLGFRGDAIVQLDWCVGEIVKTIDRLKLSEKTLIIFCSDNGPVLDDGYKDGAREKLGAHKPAGKYRGGKYSIFEGGTRTPFVTYWPGTIQAGRVGQDGLHGRPACEYGRDDWPKTLWRCVSPTVSMCFRPF